MKEWNDFFLATAGAAATLTGLIFVGISINLTHILSFPLLVIKASVALVLLLMILIFSVLLLVPGESHHVLGYETILLGLIVWILITRADFKIYDQSLKQFKRIYLFTFMFDQLATILYVIGGIFVIRFGASGLYWTVMAIVLSFIKSVYDAWVLLIEIKR
jgi:hypothetical protein